MMKDFMGLILDISTFSEGYRRNMSTCRHTQTLAAIVSNTGKMLGVMGNQWPIEMSDREE